MTLDWQKLWRVFINSVPLQALTMGLLTAVMAAVLSSLAPATFTAFDWTAYDTWLRHRMPIAVSPSLTVVVRDAISEERLGAILDRSLLAHVITAAHETGASAIGLDHRLDHENSAQTGGAASDALLMEAVQLAAPVVFVYDPTSTLRSDAILFGHVLVSTDADHVSRRVPLLTTIETQTVPAFGSVLYDLSRRQTAGAAQPMITGVATMLVNPVGTGSLSSLPVIALSSVWDAMQQQDDAKLEEWFKDKLVVIVSDPPAPQAPRLLPTGQLVNGLTAHLHLLNSLLTGNRLYHTSSVGHYGISALLASLVAWCLLRLRGSLSVLAAGSTIAIYVTLTIAALPIIHLVLPLTMPLVAALLVLVGTTTWTHLTAGQRLILLEQDILRVQQDAAAVREALVLRESRTESLQEDLAAAKAAAALSAAEQKSLAHATGSLRSQVAEAQAQEEHARQQLAHLERQLHDLRAAAVDSGTVSDAELEQLRQECRGLGIVTKDASLLRLYRDVKKGARSMLTVLILGEPGTGKELFARAVHRLSPRAGRPFIAVNMAAISPELFESELFGHVKGSFTGATADRRGYFELADHGTIFLDEIGDLRLDHQSKLLRVIQERSFYRVGATTPTTVDVRIVAATNRDLLRGVSEGWFREDLYFRLKGLVFRLPPLRERTGDVAVLAEAALADMAAQIGRAAPKFSNEAVRLLQDQPWPGNVRELRQAIERAVTLSDGPVLTGNSFSFELDRPLLTDKPIGMVALLPESAGDAAMLNSLREQSFDMQATAKTLGWDRSTVTQRLKGLCFQALVESGGDQAKAAMTVASDPRHLRTVELKLMDYYGHLLSVIEPFETVEDALVECKRRFKNLPDRHFASVETLVRQHIAKKHTPLGVIRSS